LDDKYMDEIKQREQILDKVYNGKRITADERVWLITHSVYNRRLDFLAYNVAVEHLEAKKWYALKIKVESILYDERIIPIINVPASKGQIVTDLDLTDIDGKSVSTHSVKMLGLEWDDGHREFEVEYYSALGLLSVQYECDYFDSKQNLHMRKSSSTGDPDFAIIRQVVDDHKVRYCCKSPLNDTFDAMVFTIEWEEMMGL